LFNSNCGDVDRRHLWQVRVPDGGLRQVSNGIGVEWSPQGLSDGRTLVYVGADARPPARPIFKQGPGDMASVEALAPETWPKDFPSNSLAFPQQAIFKSTDGLEVHGQLFVPAGTKPGDKHPALIFLHGGPIRQMLLGWHYMYYYSNSY